MEERIKVERDRIEYIDIAKAIGIFCVLLGHTVNSDTSMKVFLYAFHMPLFFILSGMGIRINPKENSIWLWKLILKKLYSLMFPYLIWGLIYAPFSFKNIVLIAYGTRETLSAANSLTSLWFLPVIFLSTSLIVFAFYLVFNEPKTARKEKVLDVCPEITISNTPGKYIMICLMGVVCLVIGFWVPHRDGYGDPWGIDIAFVAAGFVDIGYLLRPLFDRMKNSVICCFVLAGIGLVFLLVSVYFNATTVGYVLMANAIYGNILLFLVGAMGGSIATISLAVIMEKIHIIAKKILIYIGQNTLGIFLIHKPIVEFGRKIITIAGFDYNSIMYSFIVAISGLVISLIIVYIINFILPEIIGKKKMTKANKSILN